MENLLFTVGLKNLIGPNHNLEKGVINCLKQVLKRKKDMMYP